MNKKLQISERPLPSNITLLRKLTGARGLLGRQPASQSCGLFAYRYLESVEVWNNRL